MYEIKDNASINNLLQIREFSGKIKLVFDEIKKLIIGGRFQFEDGKKEFMDKKNQFFVLLNEIILNDNVKKKLSEKYNLDEIQLLKDADFSLIFDIYKLLEDYFESLYKPLDEKMILPKLKLLKILEVPEILDRSYISSVFGNDVVVNENNCYEIFTDFNWSQYDEGDLKIKSEYLKEFLKLKKSKDKELNRFVVFLIKNIREYFEEIMEKTKVIKNKQDIEERSNILEEIFSDGLSFFDEFISWANDNIEKYFNFEDLKSLEDLKSNELKYSLFLKFKKNFSLKYIDKILIKYEEMLKNNDKLKEGDYSYILRDIYYVSELYGDSKMSEQKFFVGLKNNFLLGDIYDLLNKKIEKFPSLKSSINGKLLDELNNYNNKLKLIL